MMYLMLMNNKFFNQLTQKYSQVNYNSQGKILNKVKLRVVWEKNEIYLCVYLIKLITPKIMYPKVVKKDNLDQLKSLGSTT